MMIHLIAEISKGGVLPNGRKMIQPRRVIYQCAYDDVQDTVKPRLEKAGADCNHVAFIKEYDKKSVKDGREKMLTLDNDRIFQDIKAFQPRLVVLDTISPFLSEKGYLSEIRKLSIWARICNCAVVITDSLTKKGHGKESYVNNPYIVSVLRAKPINSIREVRHIRNDLAPLGRTIKFEINESSWFRWIGIGDEEPGPAQDKRQRMTKLKTKADYAADLLIKALNYHDVTAVEIHRMLEKHGICSKTIQQTKKDLGITSYRSNRRWYWHLE